MVHVRQYEVADAHVRKLLSDMRISTAKAHQADGHLGQPLFAIGAEKTLTIKPAHISHPIARRLVDQYG